ncbi:MAG: hypothetical protein AAFO91_04760, partial [Bacteroidota bacterium]
DPITGADSFLITINSTSGPQIFQDSLTYTVGGLMEGDEVVIFVTPLGEGACSPITSTSCTATSCPDLTVTLPDQPVPFCIDQDPVMLSGTVDNGNNGTVIWSGPGVTNDVFDPIDAGVGLHTIMFNYEEPGPCILIDSFQIEVFPLPENDFMLNASEICVNEEVVLTYTGSAGPGAQYLWGIGGASMISQPDPNEEEYELVYDSPGTYFVTLVVTENGCFSPQAIDSIVVFEPLGQVVLNCGINGLNETTVEWTYGGTATLFEVVVGGVIVDTITGNSYTQTGLMPGEIVDFTITPITLTDPCGDGDPASISCSAAPCPDLSINLPATPFQLCVDDDPLALNETIINGSGGTVTWSGTGVMSNEFDPADAGVGLFTLIVDYSEAGPCTLQDSFQVEVLPLPASDFDFDPTAACVGETIEVSYTGLADASATYTWDFGSATVLSGSGQGPYQISYTAAGPQSVSLTVTEDGCEGPETVQTIEISAPLAAPVISCINPGLEEVTFSWDPIAGASCYEITVVSSGATSTQTGTTFTVTGLNPGETVSIQVQALGDPPCGNGDPVEASCTSLPCPDIAVSSVTPAQSFCLNNNGGPVLLEAMSSGGDMTGTFSWSGQGVEQIGPDFFFNPD